MSITDVACPEVMRGRGQRGDRENRATGAKCYVSEIAAIQVRETDYTGRRGSLDDGRQRQRLTCLRMRWCQRQRRRGRRPHMRDDTLRVGRRITGVATIGGAYRIVARRQ